MERLYSLLSLTLSLSLFVAACKPATEKDMENLFGAPAATNTTTTVAAPVATSGPADKIQVASGNSQIAPKNTTLPNPLTAKVIDINGNPVSGVSVAFTVTTGAGTIVTGALGVTDSGGLSSAIVTLGINAGPQTYTATINSPPAAATTTSVVFSQTATTSSALAPSVGSDQNVFGAEDTAATFTLIAGTDPQSFALTYVSVTTPATGGVLSGCMNLAGSTGGADTTCTFTPTANWNGTTSFAYKVNNGTYDSTTNANVTLILSAVNDAPVLKVITNQTVTAGAVITAIDEDTDQNLDKDVDLDPMLYSCTFGGGGFGAGTACSSLFGAFTLNTASGQISWSTSYAAAVDNVQTIYTIAITGSDQQSTPLTHTQSFTVTVNPAPPVLTSLTNRLYPSNNLLHGSAYSFDVNNIRAGTPGTDTNMSYTCTFDQVVDGAVAAGASCATLPGSVATFAAATGVLNWTPNTAALGQYEIKFYGTDSVLALSAASILVTDVRLNFNGITSVTNITTTTMTLNWTANAAATSYNIYSVAGGGALTLVQTVAGGGSTSGTPTGLTANTAYTFRVNAFDSIGNLDSNIVNANATTKTIGTFAVIADIATTENTSMQTADLSCSDTYATTPVYSITSQTDASTNCTVGGVPVKVTCVPGYKTAHTAWAGNVTVNCALNGTDLLRTFAVNVSDTNRAPSLAVISNQTVPARTAITAIDVTESTASLDSDIDLDALAYTCTFTGGAYGTPTDCLSLPSDSVSFIAATGLFNWTPSYAAALTANTVYTFTVTGSDQQGTPLTGLRNFTITVNSSNKLTLTGTSPQIAGTCVPLTVSFKDVNNNLINATVNMTSTIAGFGSGVLYSEGTCTTTLTNPTIATGTSSTNFWIKDTVAQTLALTADYGVLVQGTLTLLINPDVADHLVYVAGNTQSAPPQAALAIQPQVRVVDRYENPVSGVALTFLSERGGGFCTSNSYVTSDAQGLAAVSFKNGPYDAKNTIRVTRNGSLLPDVAASGNKNYLFTQTVSAATNTGNFQQHLNNPALGKGLHLAYADFNGDGKQDLVTANYPDPSIFVYLAQSNGTFTTQTSYATGGNALHVVAGDLNADGRPDLVVANYSTANVSVFLNKNDGTGTFFAKVDYAAQTNPYKTAIYDMTGDGIKDLVVCNYTSATISILSGTGTGTFNAQVTYAAASPLSVAAGDFNGDGKPDLATANNTAGTMSLFYGTGSVGSYTLSPKIDTTLTGNLYNIMTGDINNDGRPDLVITKYVQNVVTVILGQGSLPYTFADPVNYAGGGSPLNGELKDINGDGFLDLVAPDYSGATITAYLNNGSGGFVNKTSYDIEAAGNPYHVAVFDADGDAKQDIFYIMYTLGYVGMLKGTGTGLFRTNEMILAGTGTQALYVEAVDLNNDGKMDIVSDVYSGSLLDIFMGNGNGTFQAKTTVTSGGAYPSKPVFMDFNQDGKTDIAVANYGGSTLSVFLGNGDGTFQPKIDKVVGTGSFGLAVADFNKDGKPDAAITDYNNSQMQIYLGDGVGSFGAATNYPTSSTQPYDIAAGDIDGDGDIDLVMTIYATVVAINVFKNNGTGGFGPYTAYTIGGTGYNMKLADVNADGMLDIIAVVNSANAISVYLNKNDGTGTFLAKTDYTGVTAPLNVAVADVDGDGKGDIISSNNNSNTFAIFKGTGLGAFGAPVLYTVNAAASLVRTNSVADFDNDGKMDIVVTQNTTNKISVFFGW